jgi:hypothetical protein
MSHLTRRTLFPALIVTAAAALFAPATSAFAADGTFDKNLSFSGSPIVTVSTGSGYIHVSPGSDNQFHVIGHVHSGNGWLSAGDPDAVVKQIVANPPITQTGGIITIGHTEDHQLYNNVSINYEITAPRSSHLTLRTGSGGIEVAGISGNVSAESGSGALRLSLENAHDVDAHTGSGGVHIDGASGILQAHTGSGSIDAAGNVGADWQLSTGSGGIRISLPASAHFTLNASTGSGSVHVDQPMVMQGTMNHHHVSGNVNGGGPSLRASTGSGSITINNANGG